MSKFLLDHNSNLLFLVILFNFMWYQSLVPR